MINNFLNFSKAQLICICTTDAHYTGLALFHWGGGGGRGRFPQPIPPEKNPGEKPVVHHQNCAQ